MRRPWPLQYGVTTTVPIPMPWVILAREEGKAGVRAKVRAKVPEERLQEEAKGLRDPVSSFETQDSVRTEIAVSGAMTLRSSKQPAGSNIRSIISRSKKERPISIRMKSTPISRRKAKIKEEERARKEVRREHGVKEAPLEGRGLEEAPKVLPKAKARKGRPPKRFCQQMPVN